MTTRANHWTLKPRERAFTLIELLAATALIGLLMVAMMSVMGSIGRTERVMAAHDTAAPEVDALVRLLERDLAHAREVYAENDRVELHAFSAVDERSMEPTHRPVRIRYEVRRLGSRRWLVRRQARRDELSNRDVSAELVCADVKAVQLKSQEEAGGAAGAVIVTWADAQRPPVQVWVEPQE